MSDSMSTCENCGIKFEMPEVVTSSKILCAKCAAERRAKQKAAKAAAATPPPARPAPVSQAVGVARPSTVTRAPATSRVTESGRVTQPARHDPAAPHHEIDPRKVREADQKRMAKIGWLVTGGLTLITAIVLMFVMNKHDDVNTEKQRYEQALDQFLADIKKVDLQNEDSIKAAKDKITAKGKLWRGSRIQEEVKVWQDKLNGQQALLIKTRNLKVKLAAIEEHLGGAPTVAILGNDFADVRDQELKMQATEAGGELLERYNRAAKEVTKRYVEALRTAASAAASGTTGEQLAPYGPYEDTVRLLYHEAMANKDKEGETLYQPMWVQAYKEINEIVAKLFNEAYQSRVPWSNLLTDQGVWTPATSSSFKYTFGAGLTLVNEPGEQSGSGGLSYTPADKWRDYVLEVEVKIDSGSVVFYTRIGDKMDTKETPGFTLGTKNATIQIEYGKTYNLVISTIGNQMTVTGDGIAWADENIKPTKSRKGEVGIVAHAGTTATITKLRARHLR